MPRPIPPNSEFENQIVSASGYLFYIKDGVRHWISIPPKDYKND
tara:strand:+ start:43 stop:174 length:132 start_codon:yes stop_codon:yes gene_type:complete